MAIKVLQQNCQRGEVPFYGALESGLEVKADLVLFQEQPAFEGYSHPGYKFIRGGRAMMAIRVDCKLRYEVRQELMGEPGGDVVVVDLFTEKGRIKIVNVYDQRKFVAGRQTNQRPARDIEWERVVQGKVILAGDFNAHSPRWNKTGIKRDQGFLEKLMDDHDLEYIGNGEPTRGESTIDLVLASSGPLAAAIDYQIREEVWHATGADHAMIEWTLKEKEMGENCNLQTASKRNG